jgi:putative phosphoribosyl transferase
MKTGEVKISNDDVVLEGILTIPDEPRGIVVFAHGSGSSRMSPRNRDVAGVLQQTRLATLLFDLLTPEEYRHDLFSAEYRFNIPLLASRLSGALDWLRGDAAVASLPVGLFGASTGAAATLTVAAHDDTVRAIVSRGGRPDLARDALGGVKAPTLLIVGELDTQVLRLNQSAADRLVCEHRIEIVPRATHLFEEPGALEEVARLAAQWFARWLAGDESAGDRSKR